MIKIKICGIRRLEDVEYINEYQPDYCGFILTAGFRRSVNKEDFNKLRANVDKSIKCVGVFVNEPLESVCDYAESLDVIQLHGDENADYIKTLRNNTGCQIWKAVRAENSQIIESFDKLDVDMLLIDSYVAGKVGGSGKTADFNIIKNAHFQKPFFLAGGLDNENVLQAIKAVMPHIPVGVDISSSVETNGIKDKCKIIKITDTIRGGIYFE